MLRLSWLLASLAVGGAASSGAIPSTGLVVVEQEAGVLTLVDGAGEPAGMLLEGLVQPRGVSTDLEGNLLVVEVGTGPGDGRIHRITPDSHSVVVGGLDFPEDVEQAPDGSYLVVASSNSQVLRVPTDGGEPTPVIELEGPAIGLAITGTGPAVTVAAVPWQGRAGVARGVDGEFQLVTDPLDGGGHPAFLDGDGGLELCVPEFAAEQVSCWPVSGEAEPRRFPVAAPVAVAESGGTLYVTSESGVTAIDPETGDSSEVVGGLANPAGIMIAPDRLGGAVPVGGDRDPAPAPAPPGGAQRAPPDDGGGLPTWGLVGLLVALAGLVAALLAFLRRMFGVRPRVALGDGMEVEIVSDEEEAAIKARRAARDMAAAEARHAAAPAAPGEPADPCRDPCAEAAAAEARAQVAQQQVAEADAAQANAAAMVTTLRLGGAGLGEVLEAETRAEEAARLTDQLSREALDLVVAAGDARQRCDDCRRRNK